jgi:hypothetical protein
MAAPSLGWAGSHASSPVHKGDAGEERGPVEAQEDSSPRALRSGGPPLLHIHIDDDGILILDEDGFRVPVPPARRSGSWRGSDAPADGDALDHPGRGGADREGERDAWRRPRLRRYRYYPRRTGDQVLFRYQDQGFLRVYLEGSFNDWERLEMDLDPEEDVWEVRVDLGHGTYQYLYVLEDSTRTREKPDPANPTRIRTETRGWVSEIVVGRDGDILEPFDTYDITLTGSAGLSYQRVDGLSLYLQPQFESRRAFYPTLRGKIGYGFKSERWSIRGEFLQPVTPDDRLALTLAGYDQTDYTDQTGIGDGENTLASYLFREDYRDYYRRQGISVGLLFEEPDVLRIEGEFRSDDYSSLRRNAHTALGGRDEFWPNPRVDEGTMRSVYGRLRLGSELNHVMVAYEYAGGDALGGDYFFSQLTGRYRARMRLGRRQYLDLRLQGGSNLDGRLPVQKRYQVGGLGTVRGYRYQSLVTPDPDRPASAPLPFGGDRMALANVEYVVGVADYLETVLFFDSGTAWEGRSAELKLDDLKSSVGIGFQTGDDELRLDLVKTLDVGDSDVIAQLRLNRTF